MEFRDYLNEKRTQKGLSMRKLEEITGISQSYLSQIESGKRGIPTPNIIRKLSNGLNTSYTELMQAAGYGEKDNPIPSDSFFELLNLSPSETEKAKSNGLVAKGNGTELKKVYLDNLLSDSTVDVYFKDKFISTNQRESINKLIDIHLKGW